VSQWGKGADGINDQTNAVDIGRGWGWGEAITDVHEGVEKEGRRMELFALHIFPANSFVSDTRIDQLVRIVRSPTINNKCLLHERFELSRINILDLLPI